MSNSVWPTKQADIDKRLETDQGPTPQFFVDDDSGEPWQLVGSAGNIELTYDNLTAYLWVALERLLTGESDETITLTIRRQDMTCEEVDEIPEG